MELTAVEGVGLGVLRRNLVRGIGGGVRDAALLTGSHRQNHVAGVHEEGGRRHEQDIAAEGEEVSEPCAFGTTYM